MRIRFLGTASNGGIPQFDCQCPNCHEARISAGFKRLRSSIAVSNDDHKWFVIDCGPDFKEQITRQNWLIQDIEAITLTHLHPDHSIGLAELGFGRINEVNIVVPIGIMTEIQNLSIFKHLFDIGFTKFARSKLLKFVPIQHWPGHSCWAIVFGNNKKILFASDCAVIDDNLFKEMKKVDLIIFDGTFLNESKFNHLSINESCPILSKLNKPVIFTHINHSENISEVMKLIKQFNFELAFDNMEVSL